MKSNPSLQTSVIIILAIGLIALALSGFLNPLIKIALNPFIGAQTWISTRFQIIQSFLNAPADVALMRQRISELESDNARLQVRIVELQNQVSEAQVLASLVDFARAHSENQYIAGQVIGYDPSPFIHYVIINRGSDDGLRRGMPVVTAQGLVGHISSVTAAAARVQLITDASVAVNVHLQQADTDAVLRGQITSDISLEKIPQSANVRAGDLILTSGLGGNYPPNLVIGQVTTVRKLDFELFQTAEVQPAVDFSQLEIVLVIVNFRPVDITPLIPIPGQ
jgi:rod shape-determining protein MreC